MRIFRNPFGTVFGTLCTVAAGALLGLVLWSSHLVLVLNRADIHAENGPLENIQAIVLAIACALFLAPIAIERRSDKLILLFCSLLCYSFVLRELDVEDFNVHPALIFLGSGAGRNISIAAAFVAILSYAAFRFSYYKILAVRFLRAKTGILLIVGGVFLLVGDVFGKYHSMLHHDYFEEIFEIFAYVSILLAAFAAVLSKTEN